MRVSFTRGALDANVDCLCPDTGVAQCERIDDRAGRLEDSAVPTQLEVADIYGLEAGTVPPLSVCA